MKKKQQCFHHKSPPCGRCLKFAKDLANWIRKGSPLTQLGKGNK